MGQGTWWLIFAMIAGVGFFLGAAMLPGRGRAGGSNLPLASFLFLFSLSLIEFVLVWSARHREVPHFVGTWQIASYWFGPLLYLILRPGQRGLGWRWFIFLPGALLAALWLPFAMLPTAAKLDWLAQFQCPFYFGFAPSRLPWLLIHPWVLVVFQGAFAVYFLAKNRAMEAPRTPIQKIVPWLFLVFVAAQMVYYLLVNLPFFRPEWDYMISLAMSFCILRIGFLALNGPAYLQAPAPRPGGPGGNRQRTALAGLEEIAERVKLHVSQRQSYLNPDLRLPGLSSELGLTTHQLSQVVNEHFDRSFSDWINQFRVEHACKLLGLPECNAKEAGYQSGFNNLSTFYLAFKKEKGVTPAAFRSLRLGAKMKGA